MSTISVIDISHLILQQGNNNDFSSREETEISALIIDALQEHGFFYLTGHNIEDSLFQKVFQRSKAFFLLPYEEKSPYLMRGFEAFNKFGYVPNKLEKFDSHKPCDLKEAFDFMPAIATNQTFHKIKIFTDMQSELFEKFQKLTLFLLQLISVGLNDSENIISQSHENIISQSHNEIGNENNLTTLRTLYYPALNEKECTERVWCSEHTDYGSITLLYQDHVGGLQVLNACGDYIPVVPRKNSIVVNAADLLERWSAGRIKSIKHRVVVNNPKSSRQSIAFFCQPNNDVNIEPLFSSKDEVILDCYKQSVLTSEYLNKKIQNTWPKD